MKSEVAAFPSGAGLSRRRNVSQRNGPGADCVSACCGLIRIHSGGPTRPGPAAAPSARARRAPRDRGEGTGAPRPGDPRRLRHRNARPASQPLAAPGGPIVARSGGPARCRSGARPGGGGGAVETPRPGRAPKGHGTRPARRGGRSDWRSRIPDGRGRGRHIAHARRRGPASHPERSGGRRRRIPHARGRRPIPHGRKRETAPHRARPGARAGFPSRAGSLECDPAGRSARGVVRQRPGRGRRRPWPPSGTGRRRPDGGPGADRARTGRPAGQAVRRPSAAQSGRMFGTP